MRKLIVCNIMTLDGYYEGPGNDVMAVFDYRRDTYPEDESFDAYNAERLRAADTLLLGRKSFEGFKSYWPPVAADPTARPLQREISRLNSAIEKVVVSNSLTPAETAPWQNTRILRRAEAHARIEELKMGPGREILVFGSRTLWNDLLAHNLVDELHLMVSPVLLGEGTPLFATRPPEGFYLIDTCTWDGSGNVLLRYAAQRPGNS